MPCAYLAHHGAAAIAVSQYAQPFNKGQVFRLRLLVDMVLEEIRHIISDRIFETIIHRNSKIGEAPSLGLPVIIYDASSKGAINFLNLANEFITLNEAEVLNQN